MWAARLAVLFFLTVFGLAAHGQGDPPPSSTFKPDISITVKKHRMGADEFEITLLDGRYDPNRLRAQIAKLGEMIGVLPRGVMVQRESLDPSKPGLDFVKARFAVDGIIRPEDSTLRIDPIIKSLMDGQEPAVRSVQLVFVGVKPSAKNVQRFQTDAIDAEGFYSSEPSGLEYRIVIKTDNPDAFTFPDNIGERKAERRPSSAPSGISPVVLGLIALAGVSAGVLVYSLLLRGGGTKPRTR